MNVLAIVALLAGVLGFAAWVIRRSSDHRVLLAVAGLITALTGLVAVLLG